VVTVMVAVPAMAPLLAVTIAVPGATDTTTPALVTVATAGLLEDHMADDVRFLVRRLLYIPVATRLWVVLAGMLAEGGVTAIEVSVTGTVTLAWPLTVPKLAVMVALPVAIDVTTPEVLTVATAASLDDHTASAVRSSIEWSL
jgi:hypothetical protein